VNAIGLREQAHGSAIWDPASGYGHSGSWLQGAGFTGEVFLSDLVCNVAWADFLNRDMASFQSVDFVDDAEVAEFLDLLPASRSVWSNPPYSYKKVWFEGRKVSISEAYVRQALAVATDRVVMILPAKWLAMGKRRSRLVRIDHPPQFVLHFCERPSMPPAT
jgi:hypothetical protein